jgi:hypothetical protein
MPAAPRRYLIVVARRLPAVTVCHKCDASCNICISERLNALFALKSQRERAPHARLLSWLEQRLF